MVECGGGEMTTTTTETKSRRRGSGGSRSFETGVKQNSCTFCTINVCSTTACCFEGNKEDSIKIRHRKHQLELLLL
jgi:hypothetical protein